MQPDPWIHDDQAIVLNVKDKGLVVLTGCGHAGVVNTLKCAREMTGVNQIHAVIGGFHLTGPIFEPIVQPTVQALKEFKPGVIVPQHCTGWKATHLIAPSFQMHLHLIALELRWSSAPSAARQRAVQDSTPLKPADFRNGLNDWNMPCGPR